MNHNPLIITCPVVGAELTKQDFPQLPITPDEIALSAKQAVEAGASIIHLHVRDKNGMPSQDSAIFDCVTKKIRALSKCIIQYSTGGAVGTVVKDRFAPLTLKPDMASLSMGTMNFGFDIFENTENTILSISKAIQENGIMPELEIFDLGMMDTMNRFIKKGQIRKKFHVNFVLGVAGGMSGSIKNLVLLVNRLAPDQTWTVSGIGRYQLPLAVHAIAMGGHVRVGFEDNIYYRKNEPAKSNAQLIERIVRIAGEMDRQIATVEQASKLLKLE